MEGDAGGRAAVGLGDPDIAAVGECYALAVGGEGGEAEPSGGLSAAGDGVLGGEGEGEKEGEEEGAAHEASGKGWYEDPPFPLSAGGKRIVEDRRANSTPDFCAQEFPNGGAEQPRRLSRFRSNSIAHLVLIVGTPRPRPRPRPESPHPVPAARARSPCP